MWMFVVKFLGIIHVLQCNDINSMNQNDGSNTEHRDRNKYEDFDKSIEEILDEPIEDMFEKSSEVMSTLPTTIELSKVNTEPSVYRRYWLVSSKDNLEDKDHILSEKSNDKDANLKNKIATLVDQTLHDTERKLRSIHRVKERYKNKAPYKVGFILSLVKKSKDALNDLFNIAVKHRDDYKALEQLKIFELIVHTNVDTTNLVRQMVEIHIQHVNSSSPVQHKNRVVLL